MTSMEIHVLTAIEVFYYECSGQSLVQQIDNLIMQFITPNYLLSYSYIYRSNIKKEPHSTRIVSPRVKFQLKNYKHSLSWSKL